MIYGKMLGDFLLRSLKKDGTNQRKGSCKTYGMLPAIYQNRIAEGNITDRIRSKNARMGVLH